MLVGFTSIQASNDDGIVLNYSFSDSIDRSGYQNNFINHGATLTNDRFGCPKSAMLFDGENDYLEIPTSSTYQLTQFPFTVSMWYKTNDSLRAHPLFSNALSNNSRYSGLIVNQILDKTDNSNLLTSSYGDNGGSGPGNRKATSIKHFENNSWHQVVIVCHSFDSTQIFFDGKLQSTTLSGSATSMVIAQNAKGLIGTYNFQGTTSYFKGVMDELKMWNSALTPEDIKTNYQPSNLVLDLEFNDNFNDNSIYENNANNYGGTFTEDRFGNVNSAVLLNGIDNYLDIPSDTSYQLEKFPFSFSVWYKTNDSVRTHPIFSNALLDDNAYSGFIVNQIGTTSTTANYLSASYGDSRGSGSPNRKATTIHDFKNNVWHQAVVVCHSFDSTQIFLDGNLKATTESGSAYTFVIPENALGYIGKTEFSGVSSYFSGAIDELKMWNTALTPEQVTKGYIPAVGIVGLTNFKVKNSFVFYPNPSKDKITFLEEVSALKIINVNGVTVLNETNVYESNISFLEEGFYILIATSKDGSVSESSFVKKN